MNTMQSVLMTMRSAQDWTGRSNAEQFAHLLIGQDNFLLPEKVDIEEPERYDFSVADLTRFYEAWTADPGWVFLKRKAPYQAWMVMQLKARAAGRFNEIRAGFDERYFRKKEKVDRLLSAMTAIYGWGSPVHAYASHAEEWNAKNLFGVPTRVAGGQVVSTGGIRLEEGLPGIYWANYFGPLFAEFFGRKKFQGVPAFHKAELVDGGYLLLTAPSPLDFRSPEVHSLQERIIDHLGRDAFFEKKSPLKRCRTPKFEAAPRPQVVVSDPLPEAIPDLPRFVKEARKLADALAKRLGEGADFSPGSLGSIDAFILSNDALAQEPWKQDDGRRLLQELTAYYGEVVRRTLRGRWLVVRDGAGRQQPVVSLPVGRKTHVEYPFVQVVRLCTEREASDGLAIRYHLLETGQLDLLEQYVRNNLR